MAENGRYWQLEGENASAQMVDNVVTDLTDILHDGPPVGEDEKIAVVWVEGDPTAEEGSKEARDHFELGEAGGKTVIPGQNDRLVAADGQGNAKPNAGEFYSKYGAVGALPAATLQAQLPAMEFKIDGPSNEEEYWGTSHKGSFDMAWNAKVQFLGSQSLGSPVLSMADRAIIDLRGISGTGTADLGRNSRSSRNADWRALTAYNTYQGMPSPLKENSRMESDGYVYPYLQMGESSTVIMREAALLQMRDGSSIMTSGNADVAIEGAGALDRQGNPYSYEKYGDTKFYVRPGCAFVMQAGGTASGIEGYGPLFMMTENGGDYSQIFLTNQRQVNNSDIMGESGVHNYKYFGTGTPSPLTGWKLTSRPFYFVRDKIGMHATYTTPTDDKIIKPSFCIQGHSNVVVGDNGIVGARIGGSAGSHLYINMEPSSDSYSCLRFGPDAGAKFILDATPNSGSEWFIKFGGGTGGTAQVVAIEPMCDTSIKFSPSGNGAYYKSVFGLSCTPRCTDIVEQWGAFEGIFEGQQVFAQVEGNSHFEFWNDTKIIMRGDGINVLEPQVITGGPKIDISGTTSADYTGYTIEQLKEVLDRNQKSDLEGALIPTFSSTGKVHPTGGSATSTEYYEKRYRATAFPFGINKKSGSASTSNYVFYFASDNYYTSTSAVQNSSEFADAVTSRYGASAVVDSNISWTRVSRWGSYYYYINAGITNVTLTFNTATDYAIGTAWEDVAATDKTGLIAVDDSSSATVTTIDVRPDMIYNTSISGYTYTTGTHLGEDWSEPVLATDGPVNQMYGSPNLCMRGKFSLGFQGTIANQTSQIYADYPISTPVETYDPTKTEKELIAQFIKGQDYADFEIWVQSMINTNLPIRDYYFDHISGFTIENGAVKVTAAFEYKKLGKSQTPHSPTVEIIGDTELRIANGISITTDNVNGESVINIDAPEGSVSFTIAELQALKALLV